MDVMYERGVKMVCLAEALPHELFDPGPGRREDMPDEVFAFGRTASRLFEMQGQEYLKRWAHPCCFLLVVAVVAVVCRRWCIVGGRSQGCGCCRGR